MAVSAWVSGASRIACGYDLSALESGASGADGVRCPECGEADAGRVLPEMPLARWWFIPSVMATVLSYLVGSSMMRLDMEGGLTVSVLGAFGFAASVNAVMRAAASDRAQRRRRSGWAWVVTGWSGVAGFWLVMAVAWILRGG